MSGAEEARRSDAAGASSDPPAARGAGLASTPAGEASFSRRTVLWIALIGGGSFLLALVLWSLSERPSPPPGGPDSFSVSAVGHRGFIELLRELDIPVLRSRHASGERAVSGVLVVIEPSLERSSLVRLHEMVCVARTTLLVLPKWVGRPDVERPEWTAAATAIPAAELAWLLAPFGIAAEIARQEEAPPEAAWDSAVDIVPDLPAPQLLDSEDLEPLVSAEGLKLVAETAYEDRRLVVLADPDVLANHGLGRGRNADFVVALIEELRAGGPVVIDEILHGYRYVPSLGRELASYPMILLAIPVLLAAVAATWRGMVRSRAPLPPGGGLGSGKAALIGNTAELLRFGGHSGAVLLRYLDAAERMAARALHAPAGLEGEPLRQWLAKAGSSRGVSFELEGLRARVVRLARAHERPGPHRSAKLVRAAQEIRRWRMEMIDGPFVDPASG